jgi:hypothetical protein
MLFQELNLPLEVGWKRLLQLGYQGLKLLYMMLLESQKLLG